MINMGIPGGFERRIQITSPADGITEMHVLNVIIRKLQTLAGKLARQDKDRMNQIITTTDNALKELHTTLQTGHHLTEQERQDINTRITELKMHLRDRLTQRATQDDARVDTFHNIERGRMTKCSFVGIQEKKTHRQISYRRTGNNGSRCHCTSYERQVHGMHWTRTTDRGQCSYYLFRRHGHYITQTYRGSTGTGGGGNN
jgi:Trp operon repressor